VDGPYYGKRWASGAVQKVKGYGPLAIVNGGWEPTGKLVFGSAFKVVLTSVDEPKAPLTLLYICGPAGISHSLEKAAHLILLVEFLGSQLVKKGLLLSLQPVNQTLMFHNSTESELLKLKRKTRARIA
jgi:hypothetical protein